MTRKDLLEVINDHLKLLGYVKKNTTWYKEHPETITLFNLDKSNYGEQYYVSVHFLLKELDKEKFPKFNKTHNYFRSEHYFDKDQNSCLDLQNDLANEVRKVKIEELLDKSVNILRLFETKEGIKKILKQYNPRTLGIKVSAQNHLGITIT